MAGQPADRLDHGGPTGACRGDLGFRAIEQQAYRQGGQRSLDSGVERRPDDDGAIALQVAELGIAVDRDIQYSYESRTPYYIQTGWTATLTQRITGRWDVQLTGGRDRLAYQAIAQAVDGRTDFVGRFGGGIGYTVGEQTRVSFDLNSWYRSSVIPGREYGSLRAGVSVNYGY